MLPIEQDMRDIVRFDPMGADVLSLYLDTDPSREAGRNLKAQVDDAIREVPAAMSDKADAAIAQAVRAALKAVREIESIPRAVAAFACPDTGFLRVVPLPETVGRSAHWGPRIHLRPLLAALDEHERTVVALVDQEHARVFRVFMGQIEELASLAHKAPGHAQAGRATRKSGGRQRTLASMGYGERNLQRHHDWHVRLHLERARAAMRLGGDRLLLGGGRETVNELLHLLPKPVRDRTTVIEALDLHASSKTVLERVLETQRAAEREEEVVMLRELSEVGLDRAAFGAAGVAEAVSDGRVHTLMYAAAAETPGAECSGCGWLMPDGPEPSCPRCGAKMVELPEFIERLVSRVIQNGGRVEEMRGPAEAMLVKTEGLAARLRYTPSQEAASESANSEARDETSASRANRMRIGNG